MRRWYSSRPVSGRRHIRCRGLFAAIAVAGVAPVAAALEREWPIASFPLSASADGTHLVNADGRPFLAVGDAAWSAIVELTREEAEFYLADRRSRGFNMLLLNLVEHRFSTHPPANEYGERPFREPGRFDLPNPAYFDHAAWFIGRARELGFSVMLTPAYAGVGGGEDGWYQDMVAAGPARLRSYAKFLASRFAEFDNIIWTHGGDYDVPERPLVAAMAEAFSESDPERLQTVHGSPETPSGDLWAGAGWFTLDNVYTYRDVFHSVAATVSKDHHLPVLLIETAYENEHRSDEQSLRRAAYASVLGGGTGHVFGNNPIWHFESIGTWETSRSWPQELDSAGSRGMTTFRSIIEPLAWWTLRPDDGGLCGLALALRRVDCGRSEDGRLAVVYLEGQGPITVHPGLLDDGPICAAWFDPSTGESQHDAGSPWQGWREVAPPAELNASGYSDWLLVLRPCSG